MQTITQQELQTKKLYEIAGIIRNDWKNVNPAARPYLQAMQDLSSVEDKYILDSGTQIVAYFLCNASTWKGPIAREVKQYLNKLIK